MSMGVRPSVLAIFLLIIGLSAAAIYWRLPLAAPPSSTQPASSPQQEAGGRRFGLTEEERKAVYMAFLSEIPVADAKRDQWLKEQMAEVRRFLDEAERLRRISPEAAIQMTNAASAQLELVKKIGLRGDENWTRDVEWVATKAVAQRSGLREQEAAAIVEEGRSKGWRGVPVPAR